MLRRVIRRPHDTEPGYYFSVFLERLFDRKDSLTFDEQVGIATTLAEVMDEVVEPPSARFGNCGTWERAVSLSGPPVASHFAEIVTNAPSINWLAVVLRDQGLPAAQR